MKKKKDTIFLIITLILCAVLFLVKLTGLAVHMVAGCMLLIVVVKHVCKNMLKMQYMPKKIRTVDILLLISILVLFVSGMLAHVWSSIVVIKVIHGLSGIGFCVGVIVHAMQHKPKRKGAVKNVS